MAIDIRLEDGLPITVSQARNILQNATDNFGLFLDLDRILEYELEFKSRRDTLFREYKTYVKESIMPTQVEKLRLWFQETYSIPDRLFLNKANKVSFDKNVKKNLQDANIPQEAKDFLTLLNNWTYYNYRINYLKQYLSKPISFGVSDRKHRMIVANPTWNILSTSRIQAEDPSIQNIARDMKDIVCCPEGYRLIRCDSGQIEPRITYSHYINDHIIRDLIILYNDAYYGQLHYCQLPMDVYANREDYRVAKPGETGNDPMVIYKKEITDEMKAGRQELKVLALAATYGSALTGRDPVLSERYVTRIVNHPDRKVWEMRVKKAVNAGVEEFQSAFGTPIIPDENQQYTKGTPQWTPHVVRCGINNPIQTTASDLMVCSLFEASKILEKANKSHIAYYKHDEGAFYIHESEAYLIDELKDITAYNVTENGRPWIPIYADLEEGQYENKEIPTILW